MRPCTPRRGTASCFEQAIESRTELRRVVYPSSGYGLLIRIGDRSGCLSLPQRKISMYVASATKSMREERVTSPPECRQPGCARAAQRSGVMWSGFTPDRGGGRRYYGP